MLMARSGHKGISRIDHKKRNTHGWYVRVTFQGKTHAKLFSDSVHGGEEKALQRAIRYRNKLEKEVGRPRTDRTVVSKAQQVVNCRPQSVVETCDFERGEKS
jgi:hypothetical protein